MGGNKESHDRYPHLVGYFLSQGMNENGVFDLI